MEVNAPMPTLDAGWSAVIVSIVGVLGAVLLKRTSERTAKKRPAPPAKVTKDEFQTFRDAYMEDRRLLREELDDLRRRLVNRNAQVKAISAAYRHLRDAFVDFVAEANAAWKRGEQPPELTVEQRAMLDDPLDDDPDVWDSNTKTRAELEALRQEQSTTEQPPEPRRRRH